MHTVVAIGCFDSFSLEGSGKGGAVEISDFVCCFFGLEVETGDEAVDTLEVAIGDFLGF